MQTNTTVLNDSTPRGWKSPRKGKKTYKAARTNEGKQGRGSFPNRGQKTIRHVTSKMFGLDRNKSQNKHNTYSDGRLIPYGPNPFQRD